ncbi:MAG: hypothetical protein LCH61_19755 [Proteobacteria bacterium]|nr:hypothetical protein [Pseudomonadota bacterium]
MSDDHNRRPGRKPPFRRPQWGPRDVRKELNAAPGNHVLYGLHSVREALANPGRRFLRLLATENGVARLREHDDQRENGGARKVQRNDWIRIRQAERSGRIGHQDCDTKDHPQPLRMHRKTSQINESRRRRLFGEKKANDVQMIREDVIEGQTDLLT